MDTDEKHVGATTCDDRVDSLDTPTSEHGNTPPGAQYHADDGSESFDSQTKVEQGECSTHPSLQETSNPDSPRNWSRKQKWITVLTASGFGFISPVAATMLAPALPIIGSDLAIADKSAVQMILSIFVLAYAFGPLLLAPLSEVYGRVRVMQCASTVFFVFNLACGFAQNYTQILAFRFLAGIGASAPQSLGAGIVADCFSQQERGAGLRLYSVAPLLAPAVGAVIGGIVAEHATWRWIFWSLSISNAALQLCAVFTLRESWGPVVLKRKAKTMRKRLDPAADSSTTSTARNMAGNLIRAARMLSTQPIIIVVAIYSAYLFGLSFLMLSTFAQLFTSPQYYGQSLSNGSLHYFALAIGYVIGSMATAYFDDWLYPRLKARYKMEGAPELHLPAMVPATVLLPVGLFMYGWCAEARVHWILPDIGACIICVALMSAYYCINRYTVDAYTKYAASAMAATTFLRSLAAFGFPLFGPALYDALRYGWGNSALALVAIVLGIPAPWLFWFYGPAMRARSSYAAG